MGHPIESSGSRLSKRSRPRNVVRNSALSDAPLISHFKALPFRVNRGLPRIGGLSKVLEVKTINELFVLERTSVNHYSSGFPQVRFVRCRGIEVGFWEAGYRRILGRWWTVFTVKADVFPRMANLAFASAGGFRGDQRFFPQKCGLDGSRRRGGHEG